MPNKSMGFLTSTLAIGILTPSFAHAAELQPEDFSLPAAVFSKPLTLKRAGVFLYESPSSEQAFRFSPRLQREFGRTKAGFQYDLGNNFDMYGKKGRKYLDDDGLARKGFEVGVKWSMTWGGSGH